MLALFSPFIGDFCNKSKRKSCQKQAVKNTILTHKKKLFTRAFFPILSLLKACKSIIAGRANFALRGL